MQYQKTNKVIETTFGYNLREHRFDNVFSVDGPGGACRDANEVAVRNNLNVFDIGSVRRVRGEAYRYNVVLRVIEW